MSVYTIKILSPGFTIDLDQLAALDAQMAAIRADLGDDRAFVEWLIKYRMDRLIAIRMGLRTENQWNIHGVMLSSYTGTGFFVSPNKFTDTTGPFTEAAAPIGKVIHIHDDQGIAKGCYLIKTRIDDSTVEIEGIIPAVVSGLTWELHDASDADAIAILEAL